MRLSVSTLFVLFLSIAPLRADLTLEQQFSDTNRTLAVTLKLHDGMMRMDQPDDHFSVIANLTTRDSFTLLATNKTFLRRYGSEVRWEVSEERKYTGGTNEMDSAPAQAVDTGKSETVNGYETEIYTWAGAQGIKQTLWVAKTYPNYNEIRLELFKVDKFNDSGPHRNAQPILSVLPGAVVRSESVIRGHTTTNVLISAKLGPLDASLFTMPADYTAWKPPEKKNPETNSAAAH